MENVFSKARKVKTQEQSRNKKLLKMNQGYDPGSVRINPRSNAAFTCQSENLILPSCEVGTTRMSRSSALSPEGIGGKNGETADVVTLHSARRLVHLLWIER